MNRALAPVLLSVAALTAAAGMDAETRIDKTLKLSPGGEFRLDTDMGKVTVTGSSEPDAHVVITSKRKELEDLLTLRFDEGANGVTIIARKRHKFDWFSGNGDKVVYEIRVPADTHVSIETSGGGINISGLTKDANLNTSGGGIGVKDHVGNVDCDTSGGGIDLSNI